MKNKKKVAARKIILLSDGTNNAAASIWRTNVWRLFQSLDLNGDIQAARYDDGVGSSSFGLLAFIGGVFGFGLKRNVIDLYKFVCRNYQEESTERERSQIYAFGFSRGAFTARVLISLILEQGLVPYTPEMLESELDARAKAAYRAYRAKGPKSVFRIEWFFRTFSNGFGTLKNALARRRSYRPADNRIVPTIAFLGLWDTVAAYGLPINEMTRGVSRWLWPLELPNRILDDRILCARHALALDDERTTFHPVVWTEENEDPVVPDKDGSRWVKDERLSQVWFVGMHANVGGGYPDDALAHIPLIWIALEAQRCGLVFKQDPDAFKPIVAGGDKDGRIYDSRSGFGSYYRYGPRKLVDLCLSKSSDPRENVVIEVPKIHESVFKRISSDRNAYAPIGLPGKYAVVTDDGEILSVDDAGNNSRRTELYEKTQEQIDARFKLQERLWNYLWLLPITKILIVAALIHLAAFWLFHSSESAADEFLSSIRLVSEIVRLIESFLPGWCRLWTEVYAKNPWSFVIGVIALVALIALRSAIRTKIADDMRVIWLSKGQRSTIPDTAMHRMIQKFRNCDINRGFSRWMQFQFLPFLSVVFVLWLVAGIMLGIVGHTAFNIVDAMGAFCDEGSPNKLKYLNRPGDRSQPIAFATRSMCSPTGVYVEDQGIYDMYIELTSDWMDGTIPTSPSGFRSSWLSIWQNSLVYLALPLRRVSFRPWFHLIARTGAKGNSEYFLDSYSTDRTTKKYKSSFRAERDGELFLYVNDAVVPLPWIYDFFYRNNKGEASIVIERRR